MNKAQKFVKKYPDHVELMNALDKAGIKSDQDWDNETTIWTFHDGSSIEICTTVISVR